MDSLLNTPQTSQPESAIQPAATPAQSSLTRDLIVKYKAGVDPNLDKLAAEQEQNLTANIPVTSRQWKSREAKKQAAQYFKRPVVDYSSVNFDEIWGNVLRAEGGYGNHPDDPGGETKYGISKAAYPNEDIRNMTPERAKELFKADYYDAIGGDTLMKINPGIAAHVSDMAFNAGPRAAIRLLYDAVGMKRQAQITPELLDALNNSEEVIKDYSVARLKYYASLKNAPTFIKGWTNRVNNLNKALNVRSGLNGAYKSARNLDVNSLAQYKYTPMDQLVPRFKELDAQEIERLQRANEMLSPGYIRPSSKAAKQLSSLGDIFKATYDAKYYTNTISGMNELAVKSAMEASEANRKALGDKFQKSNLEKYTAGLLGGVLSVKDFEDEVNNFKQANPGVKLPYETAAQVYALSQQKAKEIEDRYNSLDSGNFKDGVKASLNKLGHVVFGYLPGQILGSLSDPAELAVNVAPLPGATSAVNIAKGAAAAMAGTGALQTIVQPKRQELGLEGGLKEGAIETVTAGAGQAILGTLTKAISGLWRSGAKETAEKVTEAATALKEHVKGDIPDAQTQQLERAVDAVIDQAKGLGRNPLGTDYNAKLTYEQQLQEATDDILNGRPIRNFTAAPNKVIDNSSKLKTFLKATEEDDSVLSNSAAAIDEWTKFKMSRVNNDPKFEVSIPVEGEAGIPKFATKEELDAFLNTKEGMALAEGEVLAREQAPDGTWYPARAADLESVESASTRFDEASSEVIGTFRGQAGSADVELAKKYPDLVKENKLQQEGINNPVYKETQDVLAKDQVLNELNDYGSKKLADLDARYETFLRDISGRSPDTLIDLGEGVAEGYSIKNIVDEVNSERSALKEMFSCMTGGSADVGN